MIRRLFTPASVLSLLLCIGLATICVRSYFSGDRIQYHSFEISHGRVTEWTARVFVASGGVGISWTTRTFTDVNELVQEPLAREVAAGGGITHERFLPTRDRMDLGPSFWNQLGFFQYSSHDVHASRIYTTSETYNDIQFPMALLVALGSVLPFTWLTVWGRRHIRALKRRCRKCGYDLRASEDRCPECGTPIRSYNHSQP